MIKKIFLIILILNMPFLLLGCQSGFGDLEIAKVADIYGKVIYPANNTIANVDNNQLISTSICLDGENCQMTDLEGNFVFYNVPVGVHTLQVNSEVLKSEEYRVNLTEEGLSGIELKARVEWVLTSLEYYQDSYSLTLYAQASAENLDSLRVSYLDSSGEYVELSRVGSYYDCTGILELNTEYTIKVDLLDSSGNEIRSFTKNISFSELGLISPADNSIVTVEKPTFTWEELEGIVDYSFYLEYYSEQQQDWYEVHEIYNNHELVDNKYTLQIDTEHGDPLVSGRQYRWRVVAWQSDNTSAGIFNIVDSKYNMFEYMPE